MASPTAARAMPVSLSGPSRTTTAPAPAEARLAFGLLAVSLVGKAIVLVRQAAPDDRAAWQDPWSLPAFCAEDAAVAAGLWALLALGRAALTRWRPRALGAFDCGAAFLYVDMIGVDSD